MPTSAFLQNLEHHLTNKYSNILRLEEDFWKLKSRINWLNDRDANTKYFHLTTIQRRRRNRISALKDTCSNWFFNPTDIHNFIFRYYQNLFTFEQTHSQYLHNDTNSHLLSTGDCYSLGTPLKNSEITQALYSFKPLKALGHDGLHPYFYQKYWGQIDTPVNTFCHQVFSNNIISPKINRTYLCLIPKVKNAKTIQQYLPISLCTTIYQKLLGQRKPASNNVSGPRTML